MAEQQVDQVQVSIVFDELKAASDVGDHRSRHQLQEACGIGSGDLDAVLDALASEGRAEEQAPDEWVIPRESERPPVEREEPDGEPEEVEEAEAEPPGPRAPIPGRPRRPLPEGQDVRVQLPMGVAKTLGADALGNVVAAGIGEAEEHGSGFVFEVTR